MVPDRVCVPVVRMRLPVPEMAPLKVPAALAIVKVLAFRVTLPAPVSAAIVSLAVRL